MRAIIQCADTGPVDSLVYMLRSVGYHCVLPSGILRDRLRKMGGLVLSNEQLQETMGYEATTVYYEVDDIQPGDVLFDVKAHQTYNRLVAEWPHLEGRVFWYRINGGEPEHVVDNRGDHGDEVNPPCPVVTPNQWYDGNDNAYTFWPTLIDRTRYSRVRVKTLADFSSPLSLVHNAEGWGYGTVIDDCRRMGVKVYGRGSPDGLIQHASVVRELRSALCMVHLKTSDAPGYALLEAMAASCPIVLPRRLIYRSRMERLFSPGVNCLTFDQYTYDDDWDNCSREIAVHLMFLSDPTLNVKIGESGRRAYLRLEWDKHRDGQGFAEFLSKRTAK